MLIDRFGRHIDYLRVSITDRCNFRCTYCMPEDMQFAPRSENLETDELKLICQAFVELGVKKIRLTGGEPLVHPEFRQVAESLSAFDGLDTIAMTTNGALLSQHMHWLQHTRVGQLNISLDAVDPDIFTRITRVGNVHEVVAGIDAAIAAGMPRIRLNTVVSRGVNDKHLQAVLQFAIDRGVHIAFIEEMPLGDMKHYSRSQQYVSNDEVRQQLADVVGLVPMTEKRQQAGPARYYQVPGTATEVGFISPHSNNFCTSCNRVRLTRKGELVLCLGNEDAIDLRGVIRASDDPLGALKQAIVDAMQLKPEAHRFDITDDSWHVVRFMNVTGG